MKVLVVDDHAETRTLYRVILEGSGFEVDEASGDAEALALYAAAPADVVLVDLLLGDEDGGAVIRWLRDLDSESRIVAISGFLSGRADLESAARKLGAHRFLVKPVDPADLVDAIRESLAS